MPNDIPSRPQTLDDLITGLMQSQDDSGDSADTQLFDAQVLTETVAITDATTLSVHPATYRYDAWADYAALVPLEPGLIHWWKCHEASGNLADSGSSPLTLAASGTPSYSQTGPFPHFPAETAVQGGLWYTAAIVNVPISIELWMKSNGGSYDSSFVLGAMEVTAVTNGANLSAQFTVGDNAGNYYSLPLIAAGAGWAHWVFTFDGSTTLAVWLNGVLQASLTLASAITVVTNIYYSFNLATVFAELAIYDHVLSPRVIAQHYQVGAQGVPDARYGYAVYA